MFTHNNLSKTMKLLDETENPIEKHAISKYINVVSSARFYLILTVLVFVITTLELW